jgi:hypothetical protein
MSDLDCIIQIVGGLGNQMFQYALGRRLQILRNARVRFDLSMYKVKSDRDLTLAKYQTRIPTLSILDTVTTKLAFGRTLGKAAGVLQPLREQLLWQMHEDPRLGFDEKATALRGRWYLRGWWHTPAYFQDIRSTLLQEFTPREALAKSDRELLQQIRGVNAVCLHVRRGDLVNHPIYSKQLKLQSAEYYNSALAEVTERVSGAHVFVFSDDPAWTRQNIQSQAPITFMDKHDGQSDYIDLHLMSQCRHFITANSTFSWWAAWLSDSPGKIVIVPPVWGFDGAGPPPQLIPAGWQVGVESAQYAQAAGAAT